MAEIEMAGLNEAQHEAVEHVDGPLLVLAGAGSGKTRVVTYRIARLLEKGVPASEILAVTFTNKAAGEMQQRVRSMTPSHVLISTFHSLGVRMLRESIGVMEYSQDFTIYDEEDTLKVVKDVLDGLGVDERDGKPKAFKSLISRAKNDLLDPSEVVAGESRREQWLPEVYAAYQERLQKYQALDFDDLLFMTAKMLQEYPEVREFYQDRWRYLLIDEYQDTNHAQYIISRLLIEKTHNLFVVGDPDQSIYSWRGANISNIMEFERDYPGAKIVRLEQNYRSTSNILESANQLITHNDQRYEKTLWSALGEGEKIGLFMARNEHAETEFVVEELTRYRDEKDVSYSDMAIFYRTNFQSRLLEDELLRHNIPYVIVGGISFYQRREIKDILAILRMVQSGDDFVAFTRTINLPKRGIGAKTLDALAKGVYQQQEPLLDFCRTVVQGEAGLRLTKKQREGLEDYLRMIGVLRDLASKEALSEVLKQAIELSGYLGHLRQDPETYEDRRANLEELVSKAVEWELGDGEGKSLADFLEELSLRTTLDEVSPHEKRVNLMTLHNSKGLEFRLVFLVGLEENLFPHVNSRGSMEQLEEERRLCYVGMTRAEEWLYLSAARTRFLWGTMQTMVPSRFLKEIPMERVRLIEKERVRSFVDTPSSKEEESETWTEFSSGQEVEHPQFGIGRIEGVSESSVGTLYKIRFRGETKTKSLAARYAKLKPLSAS